MITLRNITHLLIGLLTGIQSSAKALFDLQQKSFRSGGKRRGIPHFIFILSLAVFFYTQSAAQTSMFDEDWRWVHFTTESGLPSNIIYRLLETEDGTIWAGTERGLAWFDGYKWIAMDSIFGLPNELVASLTEDFDGGLLVVIDRQLYRGNKSGFQKLPIENVEIGVPFLSGTLLILSNSSLYLFKGNNLSIYDSPEMATQNSTIKLWQTTGKNIWVQTIAGLYKWGNSTWKIKMKSGSSRFNINSITENQSGSGIICISYPIEFRGLWEWDAGNLPERNQTELGDYIKELDINEYGEAYAVYFSQDVKIRINSFWMPFEPNPISSKFIIAIKTRKNGDIWVLTHNGIFLCKKTSSRWQFLSHKIGDPRNRINEILRTRDGSLWLATTSGIEVYTYNKSKTIIQIGNTKLYDLTGLAQDNNGNIWVTSGSSFEGAYRWDGVTWKYYQIAENKIPIRVHKIRKDRDGRLWFLGLSKNDVISEPKQPGAYLYDNGVFSHWSTTSGLLNDRVYAFAHGLKGELWFGTYGGLSRYYNGNWTHWTEKQGLKKNSIFCLAVDSLNHLWFGDRENGLGSVTANDSIIYLTTSYGLAHNFVWDLCADSTENLWISTSNGLSLYSKDKLYSFGSNSGLVNPQLWPVYPEKNRVLVGTKGSGVAILNLNEPLPPPPQIYLEITGTETSSAFLRWKALAFWGQPSPSEILTRYRINERAWSEWSTRHDASVAELEPGTYTYQVQAKGLFGNFDPAGATGIFTIPLPFYRNPFIVLASSLLSTAIIVLTISLTVRKRRHIQAIFRSEAKFRSVTQTTASAIFIYQDSRFEYCNPGIESLTGYTKEELSGISLLKLIPRSLFGHIQPPGSIRNLRHLIPGRYELQVYAKNGRSYWIDLTIAEVEFQGKPAKLGTAYNITERKETERQIVKYQEQLRLLTSALSTAEEKERRRLASILHDRIGQTLAFCKIKLGEYQNIMRQQPHQQSIREIRNLIDQSIQDTRSLTFELSPPILYELGLYKAIEWLSEEMKSHYNVQFVLHHLHSHRELDKEVQIICYHVIRELMTNIVKHSRVDTADIYFEHTKHQFMVHIQDHGTGFDMEEYQTRKNGNNGFGLFNIRERISQIGGMLDILTSPNKGTKVTIIIPTLQPRNHLTDQHP